MPDSAPAADPAVQFSRGAITEVVARIQTGDSTAEKQLYEAYKDRLYYLALVRTCSPHDAEDVRSETFLRVLRAIREHQLHQPAALSSFILRTLDNVALEMHRKEQRAQQPLPEELATDHAALTDYFADEAVTTAISRALDRLKPRERDFLRMWYYDELPKEEIARRTGIAGERVRLLKSRALKSFREMYLRLRKSDTNLPRKSLL